MRKFGVVFLLLILVFVFYKVTALPVLSADLVIYDGGFAGCAAAYSAAWTAPEKEIVLIVTESTLGGLGTVGGQNFADIRYWQNELVTQGSWSRWFEESGQFYNTAAMARRLVKELKAFPQITILYEHDLQKVKTRRVAGSQKITEVIVQPLGQNVGRRQGRLKIRGEVFIDASPTGKLYRGAGHAWLSGRATWPAEYLPPEEQGQWARQQAATLMFKVKGVQTPAESGIKGDLHFAVDFHGSQAIIGGQETWQNNAEIKQFNARYGQQGFALKPLNMAQDGVDSAEWWVNALLVFGVEGHLEEKAGEGLKTAKQAWQEAREIIEKPEFLEALRQFKVEENGEMYGLGAVELVWDQAKRPVVGEIMYLRETIHPPEQVLSAQAVQQAGRNFSEGADRENYATRIGLAYYLMDINAYQFSDLQSDGNYVWPVTDYLRPDWWQKGGQPVNPVYLPYEILLTKECLNLLVPGYATGCSALAWAEIRVLPNLTVLGDAAGVAAARALLFAENPADFQAVQLKWLQEKLREMGARLDK